MNCNIGVTTMKLLIVFPGLSSPYYHEYVPSYDLLRSECATRDIEIRILQYPGQEGSDGTFCGKLGPESSIDFALQEIARIEKESVPYRSLGISYGCSISMATALRAKSTAHWQKAIIWGPSPLWDVWRYFGQDEYTGKFGKGTHLCPHLDYYSQSIPPEYLIQHTPIDLTVGVGENDRHVGKNFLDYLKSLPNESNRPRNFEFISGCQHNVVPEDQGVKEYINLIFD
jgi:hypothetical protein